MKLAADRSAGPGAYAELYCLSNFSFLRGASHAEELVAQADALNYAALAITDECSVAGVVRAHVEAKRLNLPLLIGSSFLLSHHAFSEAGKNKSASSDRKPGRVSDEVNAVATSKVNLILLAQTREGYGNLCELITLGRRRAEKGQYHLSRQDLEGFAADHAHLKAMPECLAILVPHYDDPLDTMIEQAQWVARLFGSRAWVGLTQHHRAQDDRHRHDVSRAAQEAALPVTALGHAEMHIRSRKPLHDTMAAIRLGQPVAACGYELARNAERHLRTRLRLASLFPPETLAQTLVIAQRCQFSLDSLRYEYPDEVVPDGMTPDDYLRDQTYKGAARRYPAGLPESVVTQIERELALIAQLNYAAYFLTVYDIVDFARKHNILCQGRGSAANSAVCFCLWITEVDPSRSVLLFERFISAERNEPPDIDVDFEHQRREEVIQYIYKKYGRDRAALTAVVISYRPRSVLRDTGRALAVDAGIIDAVAKAHQWWDGKTALANTFSQCGLDPHTPVARQWSSLAETLMAFPRHLSQHPGGFVISRGKLSRLVPIENAAMADRSVVQWDKNDLDALGLLKVDVLALGMLSVIQRALSFTALRRGRPFQAQDIPAQDDPTFDMICEGDTIGVFQIESRAQMTMLVRLKPRAFYDLVIEVAIVRPGPIQGGMVHPYLRRRSGVEPVTYPSHAIKHVLQRTLGVPIFQEQVMQIAMEAAGFTGGEADDLRRAMAAWRRKGGIEKFRTKLLAGMLSRGYSLEFAESIFRQMEGFGEYGFPESHAASFALLAYQSAWLKRHEPEAFLAALLNSQPMGFYSPSQLVQDARRHHVEVLPIDVQHSMWEANLVFSDAARPAVRLGFNLIKGLQEAAGKRIGLARIEGAFMHLGDLTRRAKLDRPALDALAAADALRSLSGHRAQARWDAAASEQPSGLLAQTWAPDAIAPTLNPQKEGQAVLDDYHATGMTLRRHPLALLRPILQAKRFDTAATLYHYPSKRLSRACGIVTMRQRPGTAKGTIFVTLEDETGIINVIVRASLGERQRQPLLGSTLMGVYGIWQNEQNVRHLIAERLIDLSGLLGELNLKSRNFH